MLPLKSGSSFYRGRFAPSPTGHLHFGSLVTALASWLEARSRGGEWLVRIEDLDPPREMPGAAAELLTTLEAFGLHWDGQVVYQSQRHELYQHHLELLVQPGHAYPCSCSRKELAGHHIYPGFCRKKPLHPERKLAWRLAVDHQQTIHWQDEIQGTQHWPLNQAGDVIIRRRDGLWAYQLAVVVDDLQQGITHLLRGIDLIDSTPWQVWIQTCLGTAQPRQPAFHYAHLPVIVNHAGQKLSKQNHAPALDTRQASRLLYRALCALQQQPDPALQREPVSTLLEEALKNWQLSRITATAQIKEADLDSCISIV